jgi:hypothetical protein
MGRQAKARKFRSYEVARDSSIGSRVAEEVEVLGDCTSSKIVLSTAFGEEC